jgi:hypothetical protein
MDVHFIPCISVFIAIWRQKYLNSFFLSFIHLSLIYVSVSFTSLSIFLLSLQNFLSHAFILFVPTVSFILSHSYFFFRAPWRGANGLILSHKAR